MVNIPINAWFTMSSKMAFPLVALQYNTLQIDITLRPVRDLFVIRDVSNPATGTATAAPSTTNQRHAIESKLIGRIAKSASRGFIHPSFCCRGAIKKSANETEVIHTMHHCPIAFRVCCALLPAATYDSIIGQRHAPVKLVTIAMTISPTLEEPT